MPSSSGAEGVGRIRLMSDGYAYASPGMVSTACRHSVTLILAVTEIPVALCWGGNCLRGTSLLVAPMVLRKLDALNTPFVLLDLEPNHRSFRRMSLALVRGSSGAAVQQLSQPNAVALRETAKEFHAGRVGGPELDERVRSGVTALAAHWPDPGPVDPRVAWMLREMSRNPSVTLTHLARELSLSVSRASRLFSSQMGLPSRACFTAAKVWAAARCMGSGRSLTEVALDAGFADSAHFAKVWLRCYGRPPSKYFPAWRTEMDAEGLPGWSSSVPPRPAWRAQKVGG